MGKAGRKERNLAKMLKVITVTNQPERAKPLTTSLDKFGWNTDILVVPEWKGFGTKLITLYNYLKSHPEIDRFIFCDAHDVVVLGTPDEFEAKLPNKDVLLFNSERGCWPPPVQEFEHLFKPFEHGVNFLNSGVYYSPSKLFLKIFESAPPLYKSDDQWWASMLYLFGQHDIELDNNCDVFQCYSFIEDGDYAYGDTRLLNKKTDTLPIFIHGNGNTNMDKIHELLK